MNDSQLERLCALAMSLCCRSQVTQDQHTTSPYAVSRLEHVLPPMADTAAHLLGDHSVFAVLSTGLTSRVFFYDPTTLQMIGDREAPDQLVTAFTELSDVTGVAPITWVDPENNADSQLKRRQLLFATCANVILLIDTESLEIVRTWDRELLGHGVDCAIAHPHLPHVVLCTCSSNNAVALSEFDTWKECETVCESSRAQATIRKPDAIAVLPLSGRVVVGSYLKDSFWVSTTPLIGSQTLNDLAWSNAIVVTPLFGASCCGIVVDERREAIVTAADGFAYLLDPDTGKAICAPCGLPSVVGCATLTFSRGADQPVNECYVRCGNYLLRFGIEKGSPQLVVLATAKMCDEDDKKCKVTFIGPVSLWRSERTKSQKTRL